MRVDVTQHALDQGVAWLNQRTPDAARAHIIEQMHAEGTLIWMHRHDPAQLIFHRPRFAAICVCLGLVVKVLTVYRPDKGKERKWARNYRCVAVLANDPS